MKHHLMIGTWTPPGAIFTVAFDDETRALELVKRTEIPPDEPISWMAFDHARKTIYGAAMKKWSSFSVASPTEITHHSSQPLSGHPKASEADTKTRAIFVLPGKKPPYLVYGNPFYDYAGYGNSFSVDQNGGLEKHVQDFEYEDGAAIHGMVFDPAEEYLYSADMWRNKLWCHKKDTTTGQLTLVGSVTAPDSHDHPRWVEIHKSGQYLYALMESGNVLREYSIDPSTHLPSYTNRSWPLVPPSLEWKKYHPNQFRSDVVFASASHKYLFATARSNKPGVLTGYISVFKLGESGEIESQMCLVPTPTSGGHSNAVAPCPWNDEWLALTDDEIGGVEMWRWDGEFLARVARLDIHEPGFGMNAIWYD